MYESHWKLKSRPFENRSDERFYYPAESHQAALLKLRYAVENRRAAAMMCGASGIGKSLLLNSLRRQVPDFVKPIATVVFPALESAQLVRYLADQFSGAPGTEPHGDTAGVLQRFERVLRDNIAAQRHALILVDEAHLLEQYDLLEPIRLLLNVAADDASNQFGGESAWTLVLVGQSTLLTQVGRVTALDERMAVKCVLNRFQLDETCAYIDHRLRTAGGDVERIFTTEALEKVHQLSQGVPRRINRLCDLALMVGYAEDCSLLDTEHIEGVHAELATPTIA